MKIIFPTKFEVEYPKQNKNYYGNAYRGEIEQLLLKSSNFYCMYCGKNLKMDNNYLFNLEHSIEKGGYGKDKNIPFLTHCKFNLSVACPTCNQKYKTRMIEKVDERFIEKGIECLNKECKEPCEDYLRIRKEYLSKNSIILQPEGIKCEVNGEYEIKYDLIKQIFRPYKDDYKPEVYKFIQDHIARFHLNRDMATDCILEISEIIISIVNEFGKNIDIKNIMNVIKVKRFNNIIGLKYIDFIESNFKDVEILYEFSRLIIMLDYI